jgi:hypothetical protein
MIPADVEYLRLSLTGHDRAALGLIVACAVLGPLWWCRRRAGGDQPPHSP